MLDTLLRACRREGSALRLAASAWLLVCLSLSIMSAYLAPGLVTVVLMEEVPHRWTALGLWSAVPVLLVLCALRAIFLKRYLAGISWIAVVTLGFLIVWPDALIGLRLRFYASKYIYDHAVSQAEAGRCSMQDKGDWTWPAEFASCDKPVLLIFDWGGLGSSWFGVVYDAADEIVKPVKDRSPAWKTREVGRILSCSEVAVPLGWHYYLSGGDIGGDCG